MQIFFICPYCTQPYTTQSVLSGFFISCHKCQSRLKVPIHSDNYPNIIYINPKDELDPNGKSRENMRQNT